MNGGNAQPWWLEAGAASCSCCENALHVEALVHCHECDRPACPVCVIEVHETRRLICTACQAATGGE